MVRIHLSVGFDVNVGVHEGSVFPPLLFAIVICVVANSKKAGILQEILYADDLVLRPWWNC